jgi:peptidyl-prolyl cis-trans isomerase D
MAVMENIRASATNPWMKAVFAAIVIVFVFWGVGGAGGPTNQVIAEVNGKRITDTQFQRLMRNISRSQGEAKNDEEQAQLAQQAVRELIELEVLGQAAADNGIEVSADEIARYVLQVDGFRDSTGKFSDTLYKKNLKRMGLTQGRFESQIRSQITLQKLSELAWTGVKVTDGQVHRAFMQSQTKIELKMVRIPNSNLLDDVQIDDAMIDAFVQSNGGDVRARYEADFKRLYKKSRRAQLRQILIKPDALKGEKDARATIDGILAEAKAGADFSALAREHSHDLSAPNGGDVGLMAEEQLSPSVAAAVFDTAEGGITDVVTISDGLLIVKVEKIIPAETIEFDTVKADIARAITAEKGVIEVAQAYADKVLAEWKSKGEPSIEVLNEQSVIALETPSFPASSPGFPGLSDSPALMKAIASAKETGLLDEVYLVPGGRIIAEITALEIPSESDFEENRGQIQKRMELLARNEWVEAWKDDLVSRANIVQYWRP